MTSLPPASNPWQSTGPTAAAAFADDLPIARTSKLAISSFVMGMLCCVPLLGSAAVITGAFGVARISQSRGKLDGKPLAILGMVLGMISLVFWVGTTLGLVSMLRSVQHNVILPTENTMLAVDKGDWPVARTFMKPSITVTDEQWAKFRTEYQSAIGNFVKLHSDLTIEQAVKYSSRRTSLIVPRAGQLPLPVPIPYEFTKGTAMIVPIVASDQSFLDTLWRNQPIAGTVENLVIVVEGKDLIYLLPPGTAPPVNPNPDPSAMLPVTPPAAATGSPGP